MKVLVVGGGGREHALAWKIAQSPLVEQVFCAPGNAGIASVATCVEIGAGDTRRLLEFARAEGIGLTVVGPELPLTLGIVDLFEEHGLRIFGATRAAAIIEGSKAFAKELMHTQGIPTGYHRAFTDRAEAERYVAEVGVPLVIKADGLAAGKGVVVCRTLEEAREALVQIMDERLYGTAGDQVIVEEFLEGEEASFLAFTDGCTVLPMASAQDHKTVFDDDRGPNTGGMGAYSPAPVVTPELARRITDEVLVPAVRGMAAVGRTYRGVIYAGIMVTASGPKVLEFNARFGDPETQPILARMAGDIVPVLLACIDGTLDRQRIEWRPEAAVCVVMASGGYPKRHENGKPISGLEEAARVPGVTVFHSGTALREGRVVTAGGRVLGVTGLGSDVRGAIAHAYAAVEQISFAGAHYRRDIGRKALNRTCTRGGEA